MQVDSALNANGIPPNILGTQTGVDVYKVIYNTLDWDSNTVQASGLLCVPISGACDFPLISYQHGTMFDKNSAPSRFNSSEGLIGLVSASTGGIGVVPDYLGLGDSPGLHPYQHAATEAYAVIDMLRSAREAQDSLGYKLNEQLFLFGYSQGGHATMAAHKYIETKLNGEFTVTASAPLSGAYDMGGTMVDVMLSNDPYPVPSYLPYIIISWNQIYNLYTSPSDVFVSPYDNTLPPLFNGSIGGATIDNAMPNVPKLILRQNQIDSFTNTPTHPLRLALEENKTFDFIPQAPLRMFYCMGDQSVNFNNSIVAQNYFVSQGATNTAQINLDSTLDHYPCAQLAILGAKVWVDSLRIRGLQLNPVIVNESAAGAADGSVNANQLGGKQPITFLWSNGTTSQSATGLSAGQYTVTVTDAGGCSKVASVNVGVASGIGSVNFNEDDIRILPNPAGNYVITSINNIYKDYSASLYDLNGRMIKEITNSGNAQITWDLTDVSGGTYYFKFTVNGSQTITRRLMVVK